MISHQQFVEGYRKKSLRTGVDAQAAISLMERMHSPGLSKVFHYGSRKSLIWLLGITGTIITFFWVHWLIALIIAFLTVMEQTRIDRLPGLQVINYALEDPTFYQAASEAGILVIREK